MGQIKKNTSLKVNDKNVKLPGWKKNTFLLYVKCVTKTV